MAQTGYTPISIYYSATTTNVPTAGNLVAGELAINTADGKLFYKDSSGVVQTLATKGGVGSSTTTQVIYNSSGSLAGSANMTFSGTTLTLANDASISGLTVGQGKTSGVNGTAFGNGVLAANTGSNNTAVGYQAGANNTSGGVTAFGQAALNANTTGVSNSAFGQNCISNNTTGGYNTAVGFSSLASNTTASNNTAVGYQAGYSNTTGSSIQCFGYQSGYGLVTATRVTAIGEFSAYGSSTTTGYLTAVGSGGVLYANTTGVNNAGFGGNASGENGTLRNNTTGSDLSAFGWGALGSNTTGSSNTAIGRNALQANTTASYNTALGYQAGYTTSTTASNTYIGNQAGYTTTGASNTFIGGSAGYLVSSGASNTILGRYNGNQGGLDIRTSSNYIVLSDGDGNPRLYIDNNGSVYPNGTIYYQTNQNMRFPSTGGTGYVGYITSASNFQISYNSTSAGVVLTSGATSWGTFSDSRLKNVTGTYTNALADIAQIEPVKFTWKADEDNKPQVGVIAQSVQNVVPEAVESSTIEMNGTEEYLTVRYTELIPLMIASIQELKAEFDAYKATHP